MTKRPGIFHVGLSYFDPMRLWAWSLIGKSIRDEMRNRDVEVTAFEADSATLQLAHIRKMLSGGFDAIVISPYTSHYPKMIQLLERARNRGIHVVLFGSRIEGLESVPHVHSDHYTGQAQLTELVFQHIGGRGPVAYIGGRPELSAHAVRREAFESVLRRYPDIRLVFDGGQNETTQFKERGRELARDLLSKAPGVKAIIASVDFMATGVLEVLEQSRLLNKVVVSGFDGTFQAIQAVYRGTMFGTVMRNGHHLVHQAIEIALALERNAVVPAATVVPTRVITRENVVEAAFETLSYLPDLLDRVEEESKLRRMHTVVSRQEDRLRNIVKSLKRQLRE